LTEIEGLGVSVAVEAPVAYLAARLGRMGGRGPLHAAGASAAATAITHPQVWSLALWGYERVLSPWPFMLALELGVVLAEACLIAWMAELRWPQAAIASLLANSASFLAGLWLLG
jgi:hypothetical protein